MKKLIFHSIAAGFLLLLFSACTADNNYLQPSDFATVLRKEGVKIEQVNPLDPRPLGATEALELKVSGSGIGIYKFDRTSKSTKKRLDRIAENKKIYFNGIPFPIYEVHGSFFIVGLDKNPEKHRILKVLRNFR